MSTRQPLRRWSGPERRYDLLFEGGVALLVVSFLVIVAAVVFGSPDGGLTYPGGPRSTPGSAFTARYWVSSPVTDASGHVDPNGGAADFAATVVSELAGTSDTAGYGPPYNDTPNASQTIAGFSPATIAHDVLGLTQPVNTAADFVLAPLTSLLAPDDPAVAAALATYKAAGGNLAPGAPAGSVASPRQQKWLTAYAAALGKGHVVNGRISVAPGSYGPVPELVQAELKIASNGSLDGYLATGRNQLATDATKATLFYSDGQVWSQVASGQGITGDQWGVMNELWNFPGQFWLVLYAIPYHIPAIASSAAADLWVGTLIVVIGILAQLLLPWIPGLRDIPRAIPLYRMIYRRFYSLVPPHR